MSPIRPSVHPLPFSSAILMKSVACMFFFLRRLSLSRRWSPTCQLGRGSLVQRNAIVFGVFKVRDEAIKHLTCLKHHVTIWELNA